jgi:hypothetical protein
MFYDLLPYYCTYIKYIFMQKFRFLCLQILTRIRSRMDRIGLSLWIRIRIRIQVNAGSGSALNLLQINNTALMLIQFLILQNYADPFL